MANRKPHAIVFPYPYQGHITPMINLCLKLASRGFIITFVQPEFIHNSISKSHNLPAHVDIFSNFRESGLDIRYKTISDGFPVKFDRYEDGYDEYWDTMFREFPARADELVVEIVGAKDSSLFLMITDTFYSWLATPICMKHSLVNVSLWTEPATVFSINYHFDLLGRDGQFPPHGKDEGLIINCIPGVESMSTRDLMSYIQHPDMIPMLTEVVMKGFDHVKEADFILYNTVEELESQTLLALNQIRPSFAVGPINFYSEGRGSMARSLRPESDCAEWLNSKPPASVLYVSFGSISFLSGEQETAEFAYGLMQSGVFFIWVIKTDVPQGQQEKYFLPRDFEDAIKDRGLIVPWCDQNGVLSSPATGGFLTHCGWNSILESMWHGVPMICHPFLVDQPTNRKLVVDDWKIGINLCDGGRVTREEVAKKITILMTADEMKHEISVVRNKLHDSLGAQGSSKKNLDLFVENLKLNLK